MLDEIQCDTIIPQIDFAGSAIGYAKDSTGLEDCDGMEVASSHIDQSLKELLKLRTQRLQPRG